jgi:hypothetical protein
LSLLPYEAEQKDRELGARAAAARMLERYRRRVEFPKTAWCRLLPEDLNAENTGNGIDADLSARLVLLDFHFYPLE